MHIADAGRGSYAFSGTEEHEEKRMHDSIEMSQAIRLIAFCDIGKGFRTASLSIYINPRSQPLYSHEFILEIPAKAIHQSE
jgi:hypothetical protein